MVMEKPGAALKLRELPVPEPKGRQILLKVSACGVCRTDLHVLDGELPHPKLPLVLGHEIVGQAVRLGEEAKRYPLGAKLGVPWLGWTCGACRYCLSGRENLCSFARFTGYQLDGGYAEYALADEDFCFPIPSSYEDSEAAPLMCAGLIGHRALTIGEPRNFRAAPLDSVRIGLYGFGAAAHIVAQVAQYRGYQVYAFTRPGDLSGQGFAREMGAQWAGDSSEDPPEALDVALLFAPVGDLIPAALRSVVKGGTVVCAGIHMSDIPSFPYRLLWEERVVRSVANLTRADAVEFLTLAPKVPVQTRVIRFDLSAANEALESLRSGHIRGAGVLVP